ncbi:hypothetical protein MMC20_000095 [Loxospora ochrophaea]|nr:hypothetical protein [Loxospora ochrophaea]
MRRIVHSIHENLPEVVNGNFNDVRQIIEKVNGAVESDQSIEEILKLISIDTIKNKGVATEELIEKLNQNLNVQEIEQLNEFLIWTVYAFNYMTVDEMQAALYLRTGRKPLQSLDDKIVQKYSQLLRIDQDELDDSSYLKLRNSDLEDFFRKSKREKDNTDTKENHDPRISMTITIDQVKLSKVQRFFWDLSEEVVLHKFAFTAPLSSPERTVTISANQTEAHLTLIRRCFGVLLEEEFNEETKPLSEYALNNLLMHLTLLAALRTQAEDCHLESAERGEILDCLVSLLQCPEYIKRHLNERFFQQGGWLDEDLDFETIKSWLNGSEAIKKLKGSGRRWLRQVNSGGKLLVMREITMMIARQWLCNKRWSAELPFQWIKAFLEETEDETGSDSDSEDNQSGSKKVGPDIETKIDLAREAMSFQAKRILHAADWTENEAKLRPDTLWYERLGNTYLYYDELDSAKGAFLKAKELPDSSWKVSESLAEAYAVNNQKDLAVQEMEVVLAHLRIKEELTIDERDGFIKDLTKSANWQTELGNIAEAVDRLQEAIRLDSHHYRSHYDLLKMFIEKEKESEALKHLSEMGTQRAKDNKLTRLGAMLLEFSEWGEPLQYFETVFHLTRDHDVFQTILETLQSVITFAQDSNMIPNRIDLLLCYGVALAHYSKKEEHLVSALMQWEECRKLGLRAKNWADNYRALPAATDIFNSYFSEARSMHSAAYDFETHAAKFQRLTESMRYPWAAENLCCSLGSFYSLSGKQDMAQKLLMNQMKSGIDLLSDAYPESDDEGYYAIAQLSMHAGDDLNALSAWSLYDLQRCVKGNASHFNFDGCKKSMAHGDSFWFCKVCYDIGFDDGCMEKLHKGTLSRFVCSLDHEWLHLPSVDEYQTTGIDRVRVGGELQDGKRVGGQIVDVKEWLDMVREKWGIEKPKSAVQAEDDKQANGAET